MQKANSLSNLGLGSLFSNRGLWIYIIKFGAVFCVFYYGTLAIIGLSAPEGYYSPFIANNLNYIDWLRYTLLHASKAFLDIFGFHSYVPDKYILKAETGSSIKMVYTCIGYGIMSFWGAFIIANSGSWKRKLIWVLFGWLLIWFVNVIRISLLLVTLSKHQTLPFGLDNHTWFDIVVYIIIFVLIYFYHKSQGKITRNSPAVNV